MEKVSTSPALLAGIWNFFFTMDILELYDIEKLFEIKKNSIHFGEWSFELCRSLWLKQHFQTKKDTLFCFCICVSIK